MPQRNPDFEVARGSEGHELPRTRASRIFPEGEGGRSLGRTHLQGVLKAGQEAHVMSQGALKAALGALARTWGPLQVAST